MVLAAASFFLLIVLPVNFPYWAFGLVIFVNGVAMGLFAAPNQTGIMNSLPPDQRGAGAGMAGTFMNAAMVLSIGVFFSLIIIGLSSTLGPALYHGLASNGVPHATAVQISKLPPVGSLFAAFLGYNPMGTLLGPAVHQHAPRHGGLPDRPHLLPPPGLGAVLPSGIHEAFYFAAGCCLLAAVASWLRGGRYYHAEELPETDAAVMAEAA